MVRVKSPLFSHPVTFVQSYVPPTHFSNRPYDMAIQFYTGISDYRTLVILFELLG